MALGLVKLLNDVSCAVRALLSPKKLILTLGFSKRLPTSGAGVGLAGFHMDVLTCDAASDISWLLSQLPVPLGICMQEEGEVTKTRPRGAASL